MARRLATLLLAVCAVLAGMVGVPAPALAAGGDSCVKSPATGKEACIGAEWESVTYYDTTFKLSVTPYAAGVKSYTKSTKVQVRFKAEGSSTWVVRSTKAGKRSGVVFNLRNKTYGTYQIRLLVKVNGRFRVAHSEKFSSPDVIGD
ncbi:hypothetical protein Aph02nite_44250 [Actinoplanes philippinensis]|uniref:Uncharacterized protein n=1 Tax=Actinoplanes philippinensis TaxID=35752 RepID=A0A1I2IE26_9ACTN|nr:hypothetical protein [Actinoplanes philippinensis]GIE78475.1 hypothetical protein Aph02nite_44250 [Actinoplanes philippinensis]SFF38791.1 hypothetical protein SAMN05421541_109452 [Actinoplanes philippinensis]